MSDSITVPAPSTGPTPPSSQLHIYSLGKAAVNKELGESLLRVIPLEYTILADGELTSKLTEVEVDGVDSTGTHYSTSATTDNAIEADWLPMDGGYQQTAPDVRRDERVLIWRFGDSNRFFWTPLGLDNHLRKLETVTLMFSGTQDEAEEEMSPDNSYVFTVSTHEGHITLTTSVANEELTRWALQFNTREGRFILTEENGNEFFIDAANSYISLTNADHSKIELDRRDIRIHCDDHFLLEAGQSITMRTKTFKIECETYELVASQSIRMQTQSFDIETGTFQLQSDSSTFNTPNSTFSGNVSVGGNLGVTGDFTSSGSSANIAGVSISSGTINCQTVNASVRVNAPNIS